MNKLDYKEKISESVSFDMIFIEGGSFMMGSEKYDNEKPIHQVSVSGFYLGKYPVTQALWQAVMGENSSYFKGSNRPVEQVTWDDTQKFIEKLNKLTSKNYRLPSEAEWEFAARGGNQSKGFIYAGGNKLKEVGRYYGNGHGETKPAGMKLPNELGLCDMSGNIWEWCADVWHSNYDCATNDGSAWLSGGEKDWRVVRGGSWLNVDYFCRVSFRYWGLTFNWINNIGFRLAGY